MIEYADLDRLGSSYVSKRFSSLSLGYLDLHARRLPELLLRLPRASSIREQAIVGAIRWGIDHPALWELRRRPLQFTTRPAYATRERAA